MSHLAEMEGPIVRGGHGAGHESEVPVAGRSSQAADCILFGAAALLILGVAFGCAARPAGDDPARFPANDAFPQWDASGSLIAFRSDRDGNNEIYTMTATGGGLTRLTHDARSDDFWPVWSPDGTRIAYSAVEDGDCEIVVMDADGSHRNNLTRHSAFDWFESWSPDGSKLVFSSNRSGNWELYLMQADGSGLMQLTDHPLYDGEARWSPDGSRIVYASDNGQGDLDIYLMHPDGTGKARLTDDPAADRHPSWLPDGTGILFESRRDGKTQVYLMDADGARQRRLTDPGSENRDAVASPDGSRIAYRSDRDGDWDIFVMDRGGNQPQNLTSHPADDQRPAWSPDGRSIAFSSDRGLAGILSDVYRVDRDGAGLRNLTDSDSIPGREIRDVRYGPHEANVLDLWLAKEGPAPRPLVIFYHGGGFRGGDKRATMLAPLLVRLLRAGISVAGVNYRLTDVAPFPAQMLDGARAVQFLRLHASRYEIDPLRIGATGGSAGAVILLWLAFHEDLADVNDPDPVLRQSTRLAAVVAYNGQTTLDPRLFRELFDTELIHTALLRFFEITGPDDVVDPDKIRRFEEASPINYATADDPPVFMYYDQPNLPLPAGCTGEQYIHHPRLGILLKEKLDSLGVENHLRLREETPDGPPFDEYVEFFRRKFAMPEGNGGTGESGTR